MYYKPLEDVNLKGRDIRINNVEWRVVKEFKFCWVKEEIQSQYLV
jgi:hypothetical protein